MPSLGTLHAGAGTVPITPPLGVDLVGFLRRGTPAAGYAHTLEATAVVLDDGETRIAIVSADILGFIGEWGRTIRAAVATAAGCPPHHVLLSAQHTHAAPPPPGVPKIGGDPDLSPAELRWAAEVVDRIASAGRLAAQRLEPARVGAARTVVDGISVNRRQRSGNDTILGWNPDEACDRDVAVVRVDALSGAAITTLVAFACHPVVVGPEVDEISPDFVGPLRDRVRAWTGGDCCFLQGCAGNILPLEAFHDEAGPERAFGDRLAVAALGAWTAADPRPTRPAQVPYASAVPIAIWRNVPGPDVPARLGAVEVDLAIPLLPPPTAPAITALRSELEARAAALQAAGEPRSTWNPVLLHAAWARTIERQVRDGTVEHATVAPVQAIRIGDIGITAWPCEPFCELGLDVKARSSAPFPIALGYANDLIGYVATAAEYPFGGYEPGISHRHFGQPAPCDPCAGQLLVETAIELTDTLFPTPEEHP